MADPIPNNLPLQFSSFIGREREMSEAKQLLATFRLVTLTGAGGCGKTRLATEVARDLTGFQNLSGLFADGVWLVELAKLSDPALVPQKIASTLDVREQPSQPILATLTNYLHDKHLLLLLDNCEHLIDACAQLCESLLQACPHLRILATSRELLNIEGERVYLEPSLKIPDSAFHDRIAKLEEYDAVRLFIERARAAHAHFALTEQNANAVAQICRRLDGMPLAIELAAARVSALSVEQIAAHLDMSLDLLTGGKRTALPRQQTMRAALDWSYAWLSDPERALFRRFSVFAGGWTLEAAEFVCQDGYHVLHVQSLLVDKSLVLIECGEEARYRMLEPTRQYARAKLEVSGENKLMHEQHLAFYQQLAEAVEPKLFTGERLTRKKQLETEHDNLRAALEWSLSTTQEGAVETGLRLASALRRFWHFVGYYHEGRTWLEKALAKAGTDNVASTSIRAKAFYAMGYLALFHGDHISARAAVEESIRLYRKTALADQRDLAAALVILAGTLDMDNLSVARALCEESVTIGRGLDPSGKWILANAIGWKGLIARRQADYVTARLCAEECVALLRQTGDVWEAASSIAMLGTLAVRRGDYTGARALTTKRVCACFERVKINTASPAACTCSARQTFSWATMQ